MHRRPNRLLAVTALGLVGLVAWEARPSAAPPAPPPPRPSPAVRADAPAPSASSAAIALARPLFAATRRPDAPAPAVAPAPRPATVLPRLAGVSVDGGGGRAFLAWPAGGTVALAPGERLGALVLRGLGPDSAVLDGPDGEHLLHLAAGLPPPRSPAAPGGGAPAGALAAQPTPRDPNGPDWTPTSPPDGPSSPASSLEPSPAIGRDASPQVRAVLASAQALSASPEPQGCCASDLGWWRLRNAPGGASGAALRTPVRTRFP